MINRTTKFLCETTYVARHHEQNRIQALNKCTWQADKREILAQIVQKHRDEFIQKICLSKV